MATRKERWIKMRDKHIGRNTRRRWGRNKIRGKQYQLLGYTPQHTWDDGEKLVRPDMSKWIYGANPPPLPLAPRLPYVFSNFGNPKLRLWIFVHNDPYQIARENGIHVRRAVLGYHQRRVKRRGRKNGGLRGAQWRRWQAVRFARKNGFYPDNNAFGLHPTQSEFNNGAPRLPDYQPHPTRRFAEEYVAPMFFR